MNKTISVCFIFSVITLAIVLYNSTLFRLKNQPKEQLKNTTPSIVKSEKIVELYERFYVPVTNFSSLEENISFNDLLDTFKGSSTVYANSYVLDEDQSELKQYFGQGFNSKITKDVSELQEKLQKNEIALIPFEKLIPQLKTISVNNQNILDKSIPNDKIIYPKIISGKESQRNILPKSNRDINNIYSVAITGVSAISRTVQYVIDKKNDPIYPAREVMNELKKSDITTVDSESSFFDGCITTNSETTKLCGKPSSIESFQAIGADVLDLTGNHQSDFGSDKFSQSIGYFDKAGFEYFGGGKNKSDASKILYKNIGGKKIAFLGYAYFDSLNGPSYGTIAKDNVAGVNFYDPEKVKSDIARAKTNSDFVILDYQFTESYSYEPLAIQTKIFRDAIDSGADIVVGIQAHQPQKLEFYKNKPIFYGLGNFFFDQMWSEGTRQGLIPRLTFYNGKLSSIEILTTLLYDYSQPRFTTGDARKILLQNILP